MGKPAAPFEELAHEGSDVLDLLVPRNMLLHGLDEELVGVLRVVVISFVVHIKIGPTAFGGLDSGSK